MRLQALEIERFSKLRDLRVQGFSPGVTVIHGRNESGKTTLMEFVRSGMFPPGRKQRYPAAQDGDRGTLSFIMDDGREMRIEKEKNKISRPDGGLLPESVFAMDLETYESIFGMGLANLEEEVTKNVSIRNRFLSVAGARGLNAAVKACESEMSALIAARRTNDPRTLIDLAMTDLERLEEELSERQEALDRHEGAMRELEAAEAEVSALRQRREALGRELRECEGVLSQWGNWQRLRSLEAEVAGLSYARGFPAKGLSELERLEREASSDERRILELDAELGPLRDAILEHRPDPILEREPRVRRLQGLVEAQRHRQESMLGQREGIRSLEAELEDERGALGWPGDLLSMRADQELESALRELGEELAGIRGEELSMRSRVEVWKDASPELDPAGWDALRALARHREALASLEADLLRQRSARTLRRSLLLTVSALSLALGAALALLASEPLWGGLLLAAGAGALGWGLLSLSRLDGMNPEMAERRESLEAEAEELRALGLDPSEGVERSIPELKESLSRRLRDQSREESLEALDGRLEALGERREGLLGELAAILGRKGLPTGLDVQGARDSLPRLRALQRAHRELGSRRRELEELEARERGEMSEMLELCRELEVGCPDFPTGAALLGERLARAERAEREQESRRQAEASKSRDREKIEKTLAHAREQQARLLGDLSEEGFLRMGEDHELLRRQEAELQTLRASIRDAFGGEEGMNAMAEAMDSSDLAALEERRESLSSHRREADGEWQERNERVGGLRSEIKALRAEEGIAQVAQDLEARRAEAEGLARRYARASLSLQLMEAARDRFMAERQPGVIEAADRYLEMMTGGRYRMILDMGSMEVAVEEREGLERKAAGQWSSGLGDQIQLSLRLAMAEEMGRPESLPLMLDDVLVRFDQGRKEGAAKAVHAFSSGGRQALVFTCDEGTVAAFRGLEGVTFLRLRDGAVMMEEESLSISR